jgi:uncharacterized membrane protein YcaP (DUF421 family)
MAHDYKSITEGFVLIGTLAFWDLLLNSLAYRFRWAEKLIEPPPIPMIKDGKLVRRNMRRELITKDELLSQLRLHEVTSLDEVDSCVLESNGEFSVVRKSGIPSHPAAPHKKPSPAAR